jgi:eukaryotic-like serine/threonine-protein kinase
VLGQRIKSRRDFDTLAEAAMDPDLRHVLSRYARFLRDAEPSLQLAKGEDDEAPPVSAGPTASLSALEALASDLAPEGSARSESLRTVLVRLHAALAAAMNVKSLAALSTSDSSDPDVVAAVETWMATLGQMCTGARSRLDPDLPQTSVQAPHPHLLSVAVSRVLAGTEPTLHDDVLAPAIEELTGAVPLGIARLVSGLLWSLGGLPTERPSAEPMPMNVAEQLPAWLPARRTIGGFYVVRALGVGGTASVFVVTRSEDKHFDHAERLALKVPDYTATAARSVSQEEFLELFRHEASALMMLPGHVNLARFVTFDVGARPLPILVMELVEGVTLERVILSRTFDMKRCLRVMDDVLAGLEAMHSVDIGHLDLKPSNVVLRKNEQGVLVDFGLAGRKIRQGCGTGPYGAPEVWGAVAEDVQPSATKADIYSFGCMAFEMLTGQVLFDAQSEVAQISMHVSHDGFPQPMRSLLANPEVAPLAEVLVPTLRRDPGTARPPKSSGATSAPSHPWSTTQPGRSRSAAAADAL